MTETMMYDESQLVPFRRYVMRTPGVAASQAEGEGGREVTAVEARLRGAVPTRRVFFVAMT